MQGLIAALSPFDIVLCLMLLINIAATLGVMLLGGWHTLASRVARRRGAGQPVHVTDAAVVPFVSVHVATHDEPPAMVIATLRALDALDWPAFEVIVVDNNTADPAVWQPVQAECLALGPRFRFLHREGVTGAKAGALNIALDHSCPRASYVAVVDADYQVSPQFLRLAVAACSDGATHFVQFPQDYHALDAAPAIGRELRAYFQTFPVAANASDASLLTGTLSLIRIDALRRLGGWPTASITEDADLGVALWQAGARGRYVDMAAGQGLLPLDYAGLRVQRERWVAGNAQVLFRLMRNAPRGGRGLLAVVAQLTGWPTFLGLPAAVLFFAAATALLSGKLAMVGAWPVVTLATVSLWLALAAVLLRGIVQGGVAVSGVKSALWWTASFAWLPVLWGARPSFHRTPKVSGQGAGAGMRVQLDQWCALAALAAAVVFALGGAVAAALALFVSSVSLVTVLMVDRALKRVAAKANARPMPTGRRAAMVRLLPRIAA